MQKMLLTLEGGTIELDCTLRHESVTDRGKDRWSIRVSNNEVSDDDPDSCYSLGIELSHDELSRLIHQLCAFIGVYPR